MAMYPIAQTPYYPATPYANGVAPGGLPPGITLMPVLRPVQAPPAPQAAPTPAAPAATEGDVATLQRQAALATQTAAVEPDTQAPGAISPVNAVANPARSTAETAATPASPQAEAPPQPQSFAEEAGDKAGQFITQLIEGNPQLEAWLQDQQLDDPDAFVNRLKEGVQGSRLVRTLLRFDKRIVSSLPAEYEPAARQFLDWLKSPAPAAGADSSAPSDNLTVSEDPGAPEAPDMAELPTDAGPSLDEMA